MDPGTFTDARTFAVDLHVPNREFGFLDVGLEVLERSTFLDNRIDAPLEQAVFVGLDALPALPPPRRMGWLLHTSFCCSTLLARALHLGAAQVALREPLVLRRLADARHAGWPVDAFIEPTLRLLGRPWAPGGLVIIKPTHVALNVAADLIAASPGRAVLLTSTLDDFLVSNIKKTPETQGRIPELAERALNATDFGRRLGPAALAPPDLLAAAALQWAGQRMLAYGLATRLGPSRLRWLDADQLLQAPADAVAAVAGWLGSDAPEAVTRAQAEREFTRHAKATTRPYGPAQRAAEARAIGARYDADLSAAKAWFERHVAPSMPGEALEIPGDWRLGAASHPRSDRD